MIHAQRAKDDAEIVETIIRLHEICTPIAVISRQVHLPEETIRFVIQRHRLPEQQLPLQWIQPAPEKESER